MSFLPALLQKLVGDFLSLGGKLGGKFGGNFAGFFQTHKRLQNFGEIFRAFFMSKFVPRKKIFRAKFVLQMRHSKCLCAFFFLDLCIFTPLALCDFCESMMACEPSLFMAVFGTAQAFSQWSIAAATPYTQLGSGGKLAASGALGMASAFTSNDLNRCEGWEPARPSQGSHVSQSLRPATPKKSQSPKKSKNSPDTFRRLSGSSSAKWWFSLLMFWGFWGPGVQTS